MSKGKRQKCKKLIICEEKIINPDHCDKKSIRKQYIKDPAAQGNSYSLGVVVDYLDIGVRRVYVAGIASGAGGDLATATRDVFNRIDLVLNKAGGDLSDLDTMFVSVPGLDPAKKDIFLATRKEILGGDDPDDADYPASMFTGTLLVSSALLVEIQSQATFRTPEKWKIDQSQQ